MKRFLFTVAMVMLLAMALPAQSQFSQNGEFASVTLSPDPSSNVQLQVSRNTTRTENTANIFYISQSFAPDFTSLTFTEIIGDIPPSSFTGQNTQAMALNLDTSQVDTSNGGLSVTCTLDFVNGTVTCGPAATGAISLQFKENDAIRTRVLALGQETTVGPITVRTHQRSDNSTANVTGTILGMSASGGNAQVGINHSSTIEIIHTN